MVHDGRANRARNTTGGLQVGQQPGAGIDFDHRAALFVQRTRDIFHHQVNPGDIQADNARRQCRHRGDARMNVVSYVKRHIAVTLDQYLLPTGWN